MLMMLPAWPDVPDGRSVTLTLRAGVAISGRVVNADGQPAANVPGFATHPAESWRPATKTGEDGRFMLGLPPTQVWRIRAFGRQSQQVATLDQVTPGADDIFLRFPGP